MANNSNQIELVVTVEVDKANRSIKTVNANLSSIEQTAVNAARGASHGIDGLTASMAKGATAGHLFADAIEKALEFAKEWTIEAAKEAAQADRATAVMRGLPQRVSPVVRDKVQPTHSYPYQKTSVNFDLVGCPQRRAKRED